jgi:hypothetical protein
MNGLLNANPISETFLIGSRFPTTASIAILLDNLRSQEYYQLAHSVYAKNSYDYDICVFSADLNKPIVAAPFGVFYNHMIEQYNGSVLCLTIRGAINAFECGSIFNKKIWYISDISEIRTLEPSIEKLVDFFDHVIFTSDIVKTVFESVYPNLNRDKMEVCDFSLQSLEKYWI